MLDVGNVCCPHLIGVPYFPVPEKVRILPVSAFCGPCGLERRRDTLYSKHRIELPHTVLRSPGVILPMEVSGHLLVSACGILSSFRKDYVASAAEFLIFSPTVLLFVNFAPLLVVAAPGEPEDPALFAYKKHTAVCIHKRPQPVPLQKRCSFFRSSISISFLPMISCAFWSFFSASASFLSLALLSLPPIPARHAFFQSERVLGATPLSTHTLENSFPSMISEMHFHFTSVEYVFFFLPI